MSESLNVLLGTLIERLKELQTVISVRAEGNGSCGECGWSTHEGHSLTCWAGRLLPLVESVAAALPPAPPQAQDDDIPRLIAFCRQVATDGILPSRAWFTETADALSKLAASPPAQEQERLKEIKARCDAATKGPWRVGTWGGRCYKPEHGMNHPGLKGDNPCVYTWEFRPDDADERCLGIGTEQERQMVVDTSYDELCIERGDAEFIAHAREDVPYLLSLVSALPPAHGWHAEKEQP